MADNLLTDFQIEVLRSLSDGEWHNLEYQPHLVVKVRRLIHAGLITFNDSGKRPMAIATDRGLEYLDQMATP